MNRAQEAQARDAQAREAALPEQLAAAAASVDPPGTDSPGADPPRGRRVPVGDWGGARAGLTVEDKGARLELDCAHGTIGQRLTMDAKGAFQADGRYFREHGGPTLRDEKNEGLAARYSGTVSGRSLTLTVKLGDGETLGPYALALGRPPRLMKCR